MMKRVAILTALFIAGCASDGPETPLTYYHPDTIDQDIPRLTKRIGDLESQRAVLHAEVTKLYQKEDEAEHLVVPRALGEVDGKMDYGKYLQSRISAHSQLRRAEWELEREVERLKQLLDSAR
jgi:hypothetical protein